MKCGECDVEVRGDFKSCEFCSLDDHQRELLRVFLAARGNTKELERHLGVSYPTARSRLDDLLRALGIDASDPPSKGPASRRDILDGVARGEIDVEVALQRLK